MDIVSIFLILIIIVLIGSFAYLENKGLPEFLNNAESEPETENDDSPLRKIFLNYQHKSYQEWLQWILSQPENIQNAASEKIIAHLEEHPKHWGFLTLEAVECMKGFKNDKNTFHALCEFFRKCSKLWGEYKSIPNFYKKTAEVLTVLNSDKALIIMFEDLDKQSQTQAIQDKKKIIIDLLPQHATNAVIPISKIITSNNEAIATRSYALRKIKKFSPEDKQEILLKTLTDLISKYNSSSKSLKADDSQILQDILKETVKNVGQVDFFLQIQKACSNPLLQALTLDCLIDLIEARKELSKVDLMALCKLEDSKDSALRKTLSKLKQLDITEINKITTQKIRTIFERDALIENSTGPYPIPAVLEEKFATFTDAFYSSDSKRYTQCDKSTGGLLLTGDALDEKIYFARAFAEDRQFNFGYIDLEDISNKESFNKLCSIFSTLRKPYVLYINNVHLLYMTDESESGLYRTKFSQTLYVQALDAKSFIVGDISQKNSELSEETRLANSKLRNKFLAQELEMNKTDWNKYDLVEKHMKLISPSRISSVPDLCENLSESAQDLESIAFVFFVVDALAKMLIIYGAETKYSELVKLEERLRAGSDTAKKPEIKPEDIIVLEDDTSDEEIDKTEEAN